MSTTNNQKQAARQFVKEWSGKGYEKGETQRFWMALLHDVLGVENPVKAMEFENGSRYSRYKSKVSWEFICGLV